MKSFFSTREGRHYDDPPILCFACIASVGRVPSVLCFTAFVRRRRRWGRAHVTPRFVRHFNVIGYVDISDNDKGIIFKTILDNFLSTGFDGSVTWSEHVCVVPPPSPRSCTCIRLAHSYYCSTLFAMLLQMGVWRSSTRVCDRE